MKNSVLVLKASYLSAFEFKIPSFCAKGSYMNRVLGNLYPITEVVFCQLTVVGNIQGGDLGAMFLFLSRMGIQKHTFKP